MKKQNRVEERVKEAMRIKRHKLPVTKSVSHEHEVYSMGNIVNNSVVSLYSDRW